MRGSRGSRERGGEKRRETLEDGKEKTNPERLARGSLRAFGPIVRFEALGNAMLRIFGK